jgi:hypothetical protein
MGAKNFTEFDDGRDFQRLPDGTPDPRSIPNLRLALDRLGVGRGQRVNGRKLFAQIASKFGLVPTSERRRQALRWIEDDPTPVKHWLIRPRAPLYPSNRGRKMKKESFDLVSTAEAPAITGFSLDTIRAYRKTEPDFPAVARKVGNVNLFCRADLIAWKERHDARKRANNAARRTRRA